MYELNELKVKHHITPKQQTQRNSYDL
jgi:hypothetical protein